jgi:phosphomannomutase
MTMMDPDKVFGSDEIDLRGQRIAPDLFRRVGENIVLRVRETGVPSPQVLLGGDTRDDTLTLMEFLSRGIFNRGGSIILIGGDVAKPVAYFAAQRYRADVVAYVTASHVRASFNGVKIHFLDKAPHQHPVLPLAAKEVVNKREEALNDYQQYLATRFGSDAGKGRPLVMDSLYSSSWTVAPHVFRRARFSLECIHTYIDRKFRLNRALRNT